MGAPLKPARTQCVSCTLRAWETRAMKSVEAGLRVQVPPTLPWTFSVHRHMPPRRSSSANSSQPHAGCLSVDCLTENRLLAASPDACTRRRIHGRYRTNSLVISLSTYLQLHQPQFAPCTAEYCACGHTNSTPPYKSPWHTKVCCCTRHSCSITL